MALFLESTGKDFCDINLILDDQVVPAHKSILSARCTYFQGMFRSFMPPDNTVNVRQKKTIFSLIMLFTSFTHTSLADPNRRNFTLTRGFPIAATLHLLRRDENAATGCFISLSSALLLWLSQQSVGRLLQVFIGTQHHL